ncbi:tryptophan synthase subunit alpha [Pseudolysinimonas sp.]|uniref:tryptophan synthase subunit alpha n=1 Tax=Pseudolysinimonas sp. TaxID=2680009 RepID=UPI003F7D36D5
MRVAPSLEVLRAEAQDELGTVVEERLRGGEDPWAFMHEMPTVDEMVVLLLHGELAPDATTTDAALDRVIGAYPALRPTVDGLRDRIDDIRRSA